MEEIPTTAEKLLHNCMETKAIVYQLRERSLIINKNAHGIGRAKKLTRRGRMSHYRPVREKLGSLYPLVARIVELWNIEFTEIMDCNPKKVTDHLFMNRRELIELNRVSRKLQVAVETNLPVRDLDVMYSRLHDILTSYVKAWARDMGPIIIMAVCYFKFRKQLGYAEQ